MIRQKTEPAWSLDSLRLTFFLQSPEPADPDLARRLWVAISDADPEETTSRPGASFHQASGPLVGLPGVLVVGIQPARTDVAALATLQTIGVAPSLGGVDGVASVFKNLSKVAGQIGPVLRVALGCVLTHQAEDRKAAMDGLKRFLPDVVIDSDGSSEFLYQVNRPRTSKSGSGLINRISKWSVQKTLTTTLVGPVGTPQFAWRLETDLSTDADSTDVIPAARVIEVFDELLRMTLEFAESGDCK